MTDQFLEQQKKDIRWAIENNDEGELERLINNVYDAGFQDGQQESENS